MMQIDKAVVKVYETKPFNEIADAPVWALQGISEAGAEKLKEVLGVKTVRDLANLKYVRWAQAITTFAEL
jgi:hypothetical protein